MSAMNKENECSGYELSTSMEQYSAVKRNELLVCTAWERLEMPSWVTEVRQEYQCRIPHTVPENEN